MNVRHLMTLLLCVTSYTLLSPALHAAKPEDDGLRKRAEAIKGNSRYYHGIGYGETLEEADRRSLDDLCGKISLSYAQGTKTHDTQDSESFSTQGSISTFVTLSNTERLEVVSGPDKWEVLRYVDRSQVESDMAMRVEKIRTLVDQGRALEKRVEIASALKYLNWAYALSRAYTKPVMLDIDGMNHDAKTWLDSHISTMLNTLRISLDNVEERPGELDPYLVNLSVTYLDQPVADLDYSYMNNGTRIRDQHVKNGRASLAFEKLPAENIELSVYYRYDQEGSQYDPELAAVYNAGKKPVFSKSEIKVPCKGSAPDKFQIREPKVSRQEKEMAEKDALLAPASVTAPRKRVETQDVPQTRGYAVIEAMEKLWQAIETHQYASVRPLFTPDGYALFSRMMQSGKVKNAKKSPQWKVEMAGEYVVGKSIPVTIKYNGGHTVAEEIVCRFNAEDKIESVAYALSRRAEDDIFRQNSWELPARYAILQFMEDYQTAYALKRLDYISSIFSDDAVIIHGSRNPSASSKTKDDSGNYFLTDSFTFTRETKDEFIERLKRQFPQKKYIKLTFEDNEIREQSGLYSNIFWIEIKQFYSSSDYNDAGYLTLMIDMREANPTIKVRTWAPGKIPLPDLMKRYTVE